MAANLIDWTNLHPGAEVPALRVQPDAMQLFMFSAVTWNRHHVHYSKQAAVEEGLPDIVVHRALLGNFLARMLTQWLGDAGEIAALSWKVVQSAVPGRPLECTGTVDSVGPDGAVISLKIANERAEAVATGSATVRPYADN
jgi:hydroxyacyl-ACP dehydratase HTD2-like protein with hotdog domain